MTSIHFWVDWEVTATLVEEEQVVAAYIETKLLNKCLLGEFYWKSVTESYVLQAEVAHVNEILSLWIVVVATTFTCKTSHVTCIFITRIEAWECIAFANVYDTLFWFIDIVACLVSIDSEVGFTHFWEYE